MLIGAAPAAVAHAPLSTHPAIAQGHPGFQATAPDEIMAKAVPAAHLPERDLTNGCDAREEHLARIRRDGFQHQPVKEDDTVLFFLSCLWRQLLPPQREHPAPGAEYPFRFCVATSDYHRFLFRFTPF